MKKLLFILFFSLSGCYAEIPGHIIEQCIKGCKNFESKISNIRASTSNQRAHCYCDNGDVIVYSDYYVLKQ